MVSVKVFLFFSTCDACKLIATSSEHCSPPLKPTICPCDHVGSPGSPSLPLRWMALLSSGQTGLSSWYALWYTAALKLAIVITCCSPFHLATPDWLPHWFHRTNSLTSGNIITPQWWPIIPGSICQHPAPSYIFSPTIVVFCQNTILFSWGFSLSQLV